MSKKENQTFAQLFKKYRLRSEIETLSQFGDLLAQEGLYYENSLFTHWQKGDRVPKDRKAILTIIRLFAKRKGIQHLDEASALLASVNQRDLSKEEVLRCKLGNTRAAKEDSLSEISLYELKDELRNSFIKSKYIFCIVSLFIIQSLWFGRLQIEGLTDSIEAFGWSFLYSIVALIGSLFGIYRVKSRGYNNIFSFTLRLLSYGLMCQWLGLTLWNFYNISGILIPYPSWADLGYLASIPFYIFASMSLLNFRLKDSFKRRYFYLLIPPMVLLVCYSIFLHATGFYISRQTKVFLDFIYPSAEIIPILIATFSFLSYKSRGNLLFTYVSILLIGAFSIQFIADYAFIYFVQTDRYVNGGINDYMYSISYLVMNIVIFILSQYRLSKTQIIVIDKKKRSYKINNKLLLISRSGFNSMSQ